ncbi:MAG: hypothetical protein KatS3mg082_1532 [Nitrospiraceae bacterium]|jgi:uncharacterized protein YutE (UPF0331/DUF86 family)/predicted nucleotidyltransferase|nr:MAG: hypothetical protein KatS3mg082_1532 [Nitrospiraceae bacterium]
MCLEDRKRAMTSKLQLLPSDAQKRIRAIPERVAGLPGLAALWLFGSYARGDATPISDVDLAYVLDQAIVGGERDRVETSLYAVLADTLHSDEVTFVDLERAPSYMAWQVCRNGRLLWCGDAARVAQVVEAIYCQAPDIRWLRHVSDRDFLQGVGMPEPNIDKDRVIEFLRLISEDTKRLREKALLPKEQYLASPDLQAIVERRFQTATESGINIGNHLIARLGLRAPKDYADVFRILSEERVIPPELAGQMADMAKFRNLLVHVYWALDHERVWDSLPARVSVLEAFARCIAEWVKGQPEPE